MNMIENLSIIGERGMQCFLDQQEEKYRCSACGDTLCVHRNECPSCQTPVSFERLA